MKPHFAKFTACFVLVFASMSTPIHAQSDADPDRKARMERLLQKAKALRELQENQEKSRDAQIPFPPNQQEDLQNSQQEVFENLQQKEAFENLNRREAEDPLPNGMIEMDPFEDALPKTIPANPAQDFADRDIPIDLDIPNSPLRIVPPSGENGQIPHSFNFPNAPLEPIFEMFTELTGKMVLYSPELAGTVNLISGSVELSRSDAIEAITSSLALSGIVLVPLGEKFVKAVPAEEAIAHAPKLTHVDADALPDSGEFITRTVKLEQVKPSEAAEYLRLLTQTPDGLIPIDSSQTLLIHSDSVTMKQMLDVLKSIDVEPEFDYSLEVIPIRYSKVTDLYSTMISLISGGGQGTGTANNFGRNNFGGGFGGGNFGNNFGGGFGGGNFGGAFGGSNFGRGGFGGNNFGRGNASVRGITPFQASRSSTRSTPSRSSVSSNRGDFQNRLQRVIEKAAEDEEVELLSDARIVPDERSNSLLIFANKQDLTMITNMVSKVDHLLAQVLIEAIILEITLGDDLDLGVSLGQSKVGGKWKFGGNINNDASLLDGRNFFRNRRISVDDNGNPSVSDSNPLQGITGGDGFNYFGMFDDSLDIAVRAIASNSDAKIISRPRIQTSHAVPGVFVIGQQVPFVRGNTVSGFNNFNQVNVEFVPVNTTLQVAPYITPEGYIVMEIIQEISEIERQIEIDGNPTPSTGNRQASATLSVRDGDTIMLGGFIKQTKRKSRSGVPILKDIPLLGALFRSKSDNSERTELIILLRATVLETPEEAALVARQEREGIDGIKQMEEEFEAERRGRLQKNRRSKRRP